MYKILTISLILVSSLFANDIKYIYALKAYKNKDYILSYKLLDQLLLDNLQNLEFNYLLAKSAYNIGDYENALSAYERIIIYNPDNTRVWYEIAKSYYMQKNYTKSRQIFLNIQKKNPPKDISFNTKKYLITIDKKIKKHILNGSFIATLGYDSNINNRSSDDKFDILGLSYTNNTEDISDSFIQEVLLLNYTYRYKNNTHFKSNLVLFNKNINDNSEKNLQMISITPSIKYIYNKYSINYALVFDKIWSNSSSYLSDYGVKPSIDYLYSLNTKIYSHIKYIKKSYAQTIDEPKDSKLIEFLIAIKYNHSNHLFINPSFSYEKQENESENLTNIDYSSYNIGLNVNYKYSDTFSILPSIKYKSKKYSDTNSFYLKKQKDTHIKLDIAGIYIIDKSLLAHINLNYLDVKSNIDSSQYNKYTTNISIIKSF